MYSLFVKTLLLSSMVLGFSVSAADNTNTYTGSRFSDVWRLISAEPYKTLPVAEVTVSSFVVEGVNRLLDNSKRTVESREDILPNFDKLLHPNGVCLKGAWHITEQTPYTGYYAKGSEGLIIARASVALTETTQGNHRGFGLAGKIYPTTDENHSQPLETANFFVIDNLGGSKEKYYTNAAMTNQPNLAVKLRLLRLLSKASAAFGGADSNPGTRQMYQISELAMANPGQSITPKWMLVLGDVEPVSKADFRDELNVSHYNNALKFSIYTADTKKRPSKSTSKSWNKIGYMEFNASAASHACDHQLHFHHAKWRDDLVSAEIKPAPEEKDVDDLW